MAAKQLVLFDETEEELLRREVQELRSQCDRLRKGLHAKHASLEKKYLDLTFEFESFKQLLCKGQLC